MFNFLDPNLLPKIGKKPACTENYEADNLISKVYSEKIRGFIAYPSIKPPVELEFQFLCNVNISYIFLNTAVGNHKCSGIEIFSKSFNNQYVSICRAVYEAQGIVFCNSRKYSASSPPPCNTGNIELCFFKGGTYKSFLNSMGIKIVIFRTEKSVPCLGSVEVWGNPAKSCSFKTVDTVLKLAGQKNCPQAHANTEISTKNNNLVIPEDFKDDLTYELMTIPYTLPSGKTIDFTTLEKHIQGEKSFGRKPGDPFTGKKFTEGLKPVLNVGLKSRIDMFLLQNSQRPETFGLKRSLGTDTCSFSNKRFKNSVAISNDNNTEVTGTSSTSSPSDNIDFLIQKAKSNLDFISFVNYPCDGSKVEASCVLCKRSVHYLYELPCKHFYCRKCLLDLCNDEICKECKMTFVKKDVTRVDL